MKKTEIAAPILDFNDLPEPERKKKTIAYETLRPEYDCSLGKVIYLEGHEGSIRLRQICDYLLTTDLIINWDLETTSLNAYAGKILLVGFNYDNFTAYVFNPELVDYKPFAEVLKRNRSQNANIKFDCRFVKRHWGVDCNIVWDTMIANALARPGLRSQVGGNDLETMTTNYLGVQLDKDTRKEFPQGQWQTHRAIAYGGEDTLAVARIVPRTKELVAAANQTEVMQKLELPLIQVLVNMEHAGTNLDLEMVEKMKESLYPKLDKVLSEIKKLAPGLNPRSKDQKEVYFTKEIGADKLPRKENEKGQWVVSFDEESLKTIDHPLVEHLLELADIEKILNTYLIPWSTSIYEDLNIDGKEKYGHYNPETKSIHPSFTQMDTDTARLASSSPNLMNVPHKKEFRDPFTAPPGELLAINDMSQIEMRILAEIADEPVLLNIFYRRAELLEEMEALLNKYGFKEIPTDNVPEDIKKLKHQIALMDVHTQTTITVFNLNAETLDLSSPDFKDKRTACKKIGFAIPYGAGYASIAAQIALETKKPIDLEGTRRNLENYFIKHKKVDQLLKDTKRAVRMPVLDFDPILGINKPTSFTQSLSGRRRYYTFPDADDPRIKVKQGAIDRQSCNMLIQSTAADIFKLAMINIHNEFKANHPYAQMRLPVHDEIVSSTGPVKYAEEVSKVQTKLIKQAGEFYLKKVPIESSASISFRWEK